MDPLRFVRPDLVSASYSGVEPLEAVAAETGIEISNIAKLNANENPYGAPEGVQEAIEAALKTKTHVYPDPAQEALRADIAAAHGVDSAQVVAGAGADDVLEIVMRVLAPRAVVVCTPTFGMYAFLARQQRVRVVDVPRAADFSVDVPAVVEAVRREGATLVVLPSPNNPTGNLLPPAAARAILAEDCVLLADEAYVEFAGDEPDAASLLPLLRQHRNLVVTRTLSKWAGLAGLRLGYGLMDAALARVALAVKQPYNVNAAAEAAARAVFAGRPDALAVVRRLRAETTRLAAALAAVPWLHPTPSAANFVLCRVDGVPAEHVYAQLRARGVLVRYFGSQGGALANYIRVSAGRPSDTDRLLAALGEIGADMSVPRGALLRDEAAVAAAEAEVAAATGAAPEAVLFDMDGVLAEVGASYRAAIEGAAARFGVRVSAADVAAAKMRGGANNDWELTHRLVAEGWAARDVAAPLAGAAAAAAPDLTAVTREFEALYQGVEGRPGLWEREALLVSADLLRALKRHYKLAVVTGRPREPDAARFLSAHGLADLFDAVVCMEDAPGKPHPEPVRLACARLGVSGAIMLGDTVDDMRAARAAATPGPGTDPASPPATVVPLGVQLRADVRAAVAAAALHRSGAAGVLAAGCAALEALVASAERRASEQRAAVEAETEAEAEAGADATTTEAGAALQLRRVRPDALPTLARDPVSDAAREAAGDIVRKVRAGGEAALLEIGTRFGDLEAGAEYLLPRDALRSAYDALPPAQRGVIDRTVVRVRAFAEAQRQCLTDCHTALRGGEAGHRVEACDTAGCYAPGGRYPLPSSVIMTVVPARVAGCRTVVVASPHPDAVTRAAAYAAGADALLAVGGAQAIAAMAYGAGRVPRCDVVVGPGNQYVTAAKALVSGAVAIDMLAGPSEVLVLADETANPAVVAADLLAQAEHDTQATCVLVTTHAPLVAEVEAEVARQLATLPTREVAEAAVRANGVAVVCASVDEAVAVSDALAPEHLEVMTRDSKDVARRCRHYGAVFIGEGAAEVLGDYGAGPNHTLPTSGTARSYGGLSVLTFLRVRTFLSVTNLGRARQLVSDAVALAEMEGLHAHAAAARCRLAIADAAAAGGGGNALRGPTTTAAASTTAGTADEDAMVRFVIPKGRMNENVLQLLRTAGVNVQLKGRVLRPTINLSGWEVKMLKPRNGVEMLNRGTRDLGFSGVDLLEELGASNVVPVYDTGLDPVRIVAAAPKALFEADGSLPRRHLLVATEYVTLTRRWIEERGLDATIVHTSGATEVFPPEDADIIVDNTATGDTLRANGLHIFDTLATSSTHVVASRAAYDDPAKRRAIDELVLLLKSALDARDMVVVEFNVAADVDLDALIDALPALKKPTISTLYRNQGHAVKTAIARRCLPTIIPSIKSLGGSDILVTDVNQLTY